MAKDAKGHGSEKRGGELSTPDQHKLDIARQTLRMPDAIAGVMGGPTKGQAQATVDQAAANALGQDHPKSQPVPVHSGAAGRFDMHGVSAADLKQFAAIAKVHPADRAVAKRRFDQHVKTDLYAGATAQRQANSPTKRFKS